jgi:Cu-Zn family superoxide dismutase
MILSSILAAATLAAPAPAASPSPATMAHKVGPPTRAVAVLHPTQGNSVSGTVRFEAVSGGVKVTATVKGLAAGSHGFHVHEFGDCTAPDATSAGGHFNPAGHPHAGPRDAKRHAGDLGNVEAGADGGATLEWTDAAMKLDGPHGVLGHAVIVHAKADDLKTQPTGDAGGRLACGVIGVAKAE